MHSLKLNLIRHSILFQLESANPNSVPLEILYKWILLSGQRTSKENLLDHILYLKEEGYVTEVQKNISLGLTRYQITLAGLGYLMDHNLI
jgi:hypothetical protein